MEEVDNVVCTVQVILADASGVSNSTLHEVVASHKVEETSDKVEQVDGVVRVPRLHKSIDASVIHAASGSMGGTMYM